MVNIQLGDSTSWCDQYRLVWNTLEINIYHYKEGVYEKDIDWSLVNKSGSGYHFDHYFEDWKNPTEEEMVAFCLEKDIGYD